MPDPLITIFERLKRHFGQSRWWPAETPFEVVVGAILTQNTAWTNVEMAIANLKTADVLCPRKLRDLPRLRLEELIKPSGFFRQKATYLHHFCDLLVEQFDSDVNRLCHGPLDDVRRRLLAIKGVGAETADSILLYAAQRPSFVVDAYTRRIFTRLGLLQGKESYETIRRMFMAAVPQSVALYNAYHALIVQLAKTFCRKKQPQCSGCPLLGGCPYGQQADERLAEGRPA